MTLTLPIYIGAFAVIVVLCVLAAVVFDPPRRPCHRCGTKVRIGNRRCPRCSYEFTGD